MTRAAARRTEPSELATDVDAFIDRAPRFALFDACKVIEARTHLVRAGGFHSATIGQLRDYLRDAVASHGDDAIHVISVTGNGLELLGDAEPPVASDEPAAPEPTGRRPGGIVGLLHAELAPDPNNPRKHFDLQELEDLATSIVVDGLLQNLVARETAPDANGVRHLITAGERRWRAIGLAIERDEWPADRVIPVLVKKIGDEQAAIVAIIENLGRVDLRPLEEADKFHELRFVHHMGTDEIARRIHKTQRFVQQRLQLLELPQTARDALAAGLIKVEDARRILAQQARGGAPPGAAAPPRSPRQPKSGAGDSAASTAPAERAGADPELFDAEPPLTFRLEIGGKSHPRARIALMQRGEVWTGIYGANTFVGGSGGPIGEHPSRAAALDAALSCVIQSANHELARTDSVANNSSRAQAKKILLWAREIRAAEPSPDTAPAPDADPRATLDTARADALKRLVDPAFARREKALALVEQRLKIAQAAATTPPENLLHGSRQVLHRELWEEPAATAEFLALMLEALKA